MIILGNISTNSNKKTYFVSLIFMLNSISLRNVSLFLELQRMKIAAIKRPPLPLNNKSVREISNRRHLALITRKNVMIENHKENKPVLNQFLQSQARIEYSYDSRHPLSAKSNKSSNAKNNSIRAQGFKKGCLPTFKTIEMSLQLPSVTAKSWALYEMRQKKCIYSCRSQKKRQIASLTKMMNLITILQLVQSLGLDSKQIKMRVDKNACSMTGTSAQLKFDCIYSLDDLYYGMMLPSGNDAAYLIAQIGGLLLKLQKDNKNDLNLAYDCEFISANLQIMGNYCVNAYLKEMNKVAKRIQMNASNFANPHGLSNTNNYSSADDVVKLCIYAMKNSQFRKIVNTQSHKYIFVGKLDVGEKEEPETSGSQKSIGEKENWQQKKQIQYKMEDKAQHIKVWENTNRMLGEGWSGIKTGITPNAGPCLAASVMKTFNGRTYEFLVVLLNSESMESRWVEVRRLVNWAIDCKLY